MKYARFVKNTLVICLLSASPATYAGFVQVTDFNNVTLGTSVGDISDWSGTGNALPYTKIVADPTDADNHVLGTTMSTQANGVYLDLGGSAIIAGGTGTIFFRVYFSNEDNYGLSFGVGSSNSSNDRYLQAQLRARSADSNKWTIFGRSENDAAQTVSTPSTHEIETWYNVWIIINPDGAANTWEARIQEDGGELFIVSVGDKQKFDFYLHRGEGEQTDRFAIFSGATVGTGGYGSGSPVYFSDIWVDPTGRNLTNPLIPEPSTYAFVGIVGAMTMLLVRRRARKK